MTDKMFISPPTVTVSADGFLDLDSPDPSVHRILIHIDALQQYVDRINVQIREIRLLQSAGDTLVDVMIRSEIHLVDDTEWDTALKSWKDARRG
jgi:hypothetical protein